MKILIAYDGSRCAEAAIDDLARAGLPETGEALIASVAEIWLPPEGDSDNDPALEKLVAHHREKGRRALAEVQTFVAHAESRARSILPGWTIETRATYGSPSWELLSIADEINPDLIIVGSQGQTALGRLLLGSISQKVVTEAKCSVRVARGRINVDESPIRIAIGFDSSKGAQAAVGAVAQRNWPAGTEVQLVAVADGVHPTAIGRFVPPISRAIDEVNNAERSWLEELASDSLEKLRAIGCAAELKVVDGNPKKKIIEEAEAWNADAIFLGANAFGSRLERFLIGSTSSAVAARAQCSVEVVRRPA